MKAGKVATNILFVAMMMALGAGLGAMFSAILGLIGGVYEIPSFAIIGCFAGLVIATISLISDRRKQVDKEVRG